jgi:hypothetical protein
MALTTLPCATALACDANVTSLGDNVKRTEACSDSGCSDIGCTRIELTGLRSNGD